MKKFIEKNKEYQAIVNENIRLCQDIRRKKKKQIKQIKAEAKKKYQIKINRVKKNILEKSKLGEDGEEAVIRHSVLDRLDQESQLETPRFGERDSIRSPNQKQKLNFKKKRPRKQQSPNGFLNFVKKSFTFFGGGSDQENKNSESSKHNSKNSIEDELRKRKKEKEGESKIGQSKLNKESQVLVHTKYDGRTLKKTLPGRIGRSNVNNFSDDSDFESDD